MFYKKIGLYFLIIFFIYFFNSFASSKFYYAEQWYLIFNEKMKKHPKNYINNIFFLKKALSYPFGNPKYSISKVETKDQWNKYELLFKMHVNLLLLKQNLYLGNLFDTKNIYFFMAPEKERRLENIKKSESLYKIALDYYKEALKYHKEIEKYKFIKLPNGSISNWENEYYKIESKEIDYFDIIKKELARINKTKEVFSKMKNYY